MSNNPFILALSLKSPYTQRSYKCILSNYLEFINEKYPFDTSKVIQFLDYLKKKNLSQSYLSLAYNTLKLFFKVYNKPFQDIIAPKVELYYQQHPTLNIDIINKLISIIKVEGTPQEKSFLAISTTFGLRNSELCQIGQKDIREESGKYYLFIKTKKGGFARWHLIPEEIKMQILNYDFNPVPIIQGWLFFKSIYSYVQAENSEAKRIGWHSIRRSLIKYLVQQGFSEYDLGIYFRYNIAKRSIINRYARMDLDDPQLFEIDKKIFEKHPFLKTWKD